MAEITVAALQLALNSPDEAENIAAVSALVEAAAGQGARIVVFITSTVRRQIVFTWRLPAYWITNRIW